MKIIIENENNDNSELMADFCIIGTERVVFIEGNMNPNSLIISLANIVASTYNTIEEMIDTYNSSLPEDQKDHMPSLNEFLSGLFLNVNAIKQKKLNEENELVSFIHEGKEYKLDIQEYMLQSLKSKLDELFNNNEEE